MRLGKLEKFASINTFPNVIQNFDFRHPELINSNGENFFCRGKWSEMQFKNSADIILELGCGKGEYTFTMAKTFPGKNFIGVDIKGNRIYTGAKKALDENIKNAAFLRTDINLLPLFFEKDEISEIWITFPDPHLKKGKEQKRLTSERFLNYYKQFLKKNGIIHLKTDDATLYAYTLETANSLHLELIYAYDDIYAKDLIHPFVNIQTYYEKKHLDEGRKIKYVQIKL